VHTHTVHIPFSLALHIAVLEPKDAAEVVEVEAVAVAVDAIEMVIATVVAAVMVIGVIVR